MKEQYAEICAQHGYDVVISGGGSSGQKRKFKSDKIRISDSVPKNAVVGLELTNTDTAAKKANLYKMDKILQPTSLILSSSINVTATEQATWIGHKNRLVGISVLPAFAEMPLIEVAPTVFSPLRTMESVSGFFTSIGKKIEIVQDRIGMVLPRILCRIVNEAAYAITEDTAEPQDIDKALRLGNNFPIGPIEWAEKNGFEQIYSVLSALQSDLHEERYRIAPLLKQMMLTGDWWKKASTN
jgi:3-hydroxybutyryl-CoA dehydrogenase